MFNGISIICFFEIGYWILLLLFRQCFILADFNETPPNPNGMGKLKLLKMTISDFCQASNLFLKCHKKAKKIENLGVRSSWSSLFCDWAHLDW